MCMFLKRERPEMDDLERKKKFGCEGKILSIFKKKKVILDIDIQAKIFLHILSFQNILSIFFMF